MLPKTTFVITDLNGHRGDLRGVIPNNFITETTRYVLIDPDKNDSYVYSSHWDFMYDMPRITAEEYLKLKKQAEKSDGAKFGNAIDAYRAVKAGHEVVTTKWSKKVGVDSHGLYVQKYSDEKTRPESFVKDIADRNFIPTPDHKIYVTLSRETCQDNWCIIKPLPQKRYRVKHLSEIMTTPGVIMKKLDDGTVCFNVNGKLFVTYSGDSKDYPMHYACGKLLPEGFEPGMKAVVGQVDSWFHEPFVVEVEK